MKLTKCFLSGQAGFQLLEAVQEQEYKMLSLW